MSPDLLARSLQEFLSEAAHGVVFEEGQVIFDLDTCRYSISAERGRCLLHLWSQERNIVREVLDSELRNGTLRLSVRRFAQARPHQLQICRERDQRTQALRKSARTQYAVWLERVLRREFAGWELSKLSTSMNLEHSFSPVYARGLLRQGRAAMAVMGVNQEETQASVDSMLTFGLLWLEHCRQREAGRCSVGGLCLFVPRGRSATLRLRLAHLNPALARFRLFEVDERDGAYEEQDLSSLAGVESQLQRCPDKTQAYSVFREAIGMVTAAVPLAEVALQSPGEVSFRLHGLEFARARLTAQADAFRAAPEIVFGVAGFEAVLTLENQELFREFGARLSAARHPEGDRRDALWRMYPERWLESLIVGSVQAIDSRLDVNHVYSQVPAFSASDRSLIDVLTSTREGRMAVLELKADEDIHLPIQGLDYWARVARRQECGDFQKFGYFTGVQLSSQPPLLFMVAPALRVHPAIETILRYFSPTIEWTLVGVDERWREGVRVVFRKTRA